MATGMWGLVHGLAFLYLDGKLRPSTPPTVAERVAGAVRRCSVRRTATRL